ncbi:MAG TPA: DUF1573 domain-containing protein [Aggregatilineales bacterium]|jgi:hypothetical protein|nr:DUF1573 domain-containing protein [Aggregatilineales bacterium]
MSQQKKPNRSKSSSSAFARVTRPLWLIVGSVLAVSVLIVLAAAALAPGSSIPADFVPLVSGAPSLAVISDPVVDHGDVAMRTQVESRFTVQNVGDETLYILGDPRIEVVEGCCPPPAKADKRTLEPGESTTVWTRFTMNPGMGGPHDFRLHIMTNDPQTPTTSVQILSNWVE